MPNVNAGVKPKGRTYYAKKSDWARSRSHELMDKANQLKTEPVTSATMAGRRRQAIANLLAEASRFAAMAHHYAERGL